MKQDQIDRALILLYISTNAHGWSNFSMPVDVVNRHTRVPAAKAELVSTLRSLADHVERDFPGYPGIRDDHDWVNSEEPHKGKCARCGGQYRDVYLERCSLAGIDMSTAPEPKP